MSPDSGELEWEVAKGFPTLYGEGADTITGGRGGIKFFVTTLSSASVQTFVPASDGVEAHYEGSLRGALSLEEPRHIIPRVSGNVEGSISVQRSRVNDMTFHGHLAPEGGLAVINGNVAFSSVDNVVLRYLTIRFGNQAEIAGDDGLVLNRINRWAIDHCSIGWSADEDSSVFVGRDEELVYGPIIYQRTLFGQGRDAHDRGMLLGTTDSGPSSEITANIHLNFWVVAARTPNAAGEERTFVRSANSVIYDWNGRTTNLLRRPRFDEIGNYYRPGPTTVSPFFGYYLNKYQNQGEGPPSIYTAGNFVEGFLTDLEANNQVIWSRFDPNNGNGIDNDPLPTSWFRAEPLPADPNVGYAPISALEAKASIIDAREVGHNRSTNASGETVFGHDSVDDAYFVAFEATADSQVPERDWIHPARPTNAPYPDANWNGIDDAFEREHGIESADQVITEWTIDGVELVNRAGYDAFEVWSALRAGDMRR